MAQNLAAFLSALNWKKKIAVIPWNRADFLKEQNLIELNSRSFFCYAGFDIASRQEDCLCSLDFSKRLSLWRSFLKEGLEPEEFEWLICAITENALSDRMEWELALQEALEQLHFRVVNQEHSFELFDDKGKRLYFGVDCRRAAERSLMKILFPLNFL